MPEFTEMIEAETLIVDDELALRRVLSDDIADLFEIYSNPEVSRFELSRPWTLDQVAEFVDAQTDFRPGDAGAALNLVVVLRSEAKVIGNCQLTITSLESQQGVLGFSFNPRYTGRGLATRAVNAALAFGFTQLKLHRIMAAVDVRNDRSWRLMERLGMRREAHIMHGNRFNGEWIDDYHYALLSNEWTEKKTR